MEPAGRGNRVAVIGAGIAGLVTAKVLKHDGFDVTVFEKEPAIGGVWAESRTYPGLCTNNPRETYAFSDFPHLDGTQEFPTAAEVRAYLDAYVDHFGVRPLLRLATNVVRVSPCERPRGFDVTVQRSGEPASTRRCHFDFAVVCSGVFCEPHLPRLAGQERFAGRILHSSQLANLKVNRGQRIVVVGGGKSALDCAAFAGSRAASCMLVCRRPHWMLPRYIGGLRVDRVLYTRFAEKLLPAYHRTSRGERTLRRAAAPLIWLWWRCQSRLVPRQVGMPQSLVPDRPLPNGIENIGIGDDGYQALRQGRVQARRGRIESVAGADSLRLDDGEIVPADIVILATGWHQNVPVLDDELRRQVRRDVGFELYRRILPPRQQRLGFVGYASSSACPFTSELAAHWLSQCFRGELRLPDVAEMEAEIARVRQWLNRVFPQRSEGYFIGAYITHYADELLRDMGLRRHRRALLREYLGPSWPRRYATVAEERRHARPRRQGRRSGRRDEASFSG